MRTVITINPASIERAAKVIWLAAGHSEQEWVHMSPEDDVRNSYIVYATATLYAAAGAK